MPAMKITVFEKIVLSFIFIMLVIGFVLFKTNLPAFEIYIEEDGIVEWLTVLGLLLGSFLSINRVFNLSKLKSRWFIVTSLGLGLLLFFAAGEEISWGQRIFSIKSSEYFLKNNAQAETNLHNLVVDGVKLNKAIFSIGLSIAMAVYLLVLPILYRSRGFVKSFADNWGIPVARFYQIISIAVLYGLTETIRHGKRAELLEAGIAFILYLIIRYPENKRAFQKKYLIKDQPVR